MKKLRILLADDHDLVRLGLQSIIEKQNGWKICATATNGRDAVTLAKKHLPDIAILDMAMPGLDGLEATRQIRKGAPQCEILIFTGNDSDALIRNAYDAGAKGFIHKAEAGKYLLDAINSLAENRPFFTDRVSEVIFARFNKPRERGEPVETERLSADERQLLELLADGHSNRTAAKKLRSSIRTVENQRAEIMRKLKLHSFADLVRYAVRNEIITP